MSQFAVVRVADDVVIGTYSGGAEPIPPSGADHYFFGLTQEQSDMLQQGLTWGSSEPRWKIVGGELTELPDPRRRAAFITMAGTLITADQKFKVGDTDKNFKVVVLVGTSGSTVDTAVNGDKDFRLADGTWVRVTMASGEATLTLKCDKPKEVYVPDQGNLNFINNLSIRILADATF